MRVTIAPKQMVFLSTSQSMSFKAEFVGKLLALYNLKLSFYARSRRQPSFSRQIFSQAEAEV